MSSGLYKQNEQIEAKIQTNMFQDRMKQTILVVDIGFTLFKYHNEAIQSLKLETSDLLSNLSGNQTT